MMAKTGKENERSFVLSSIPSKIQNTHLFHRGSFLDVSLILQKQNPLKRISYLCQVIIEDF